MQERLTYLFLFAFAGAYIGLLLFVMVYVSKNIRKFPADVPQPLILVFLIAELIYKMKKPLFNERERQIMHMNNSLYADRMQMKIALMKFAKALEQTWMGKKLINISELIKERIK